MTGLLRVLAEGIANFFLGLYDRWRQRRDAQAALREKQLQGDLDAIKRAEKSDREVDSMSDDAVARELREYDRD